MCQISSLMAAAEGSVAEYFKFCKFGRKEKEIEPFDVISENRYLYSTTKLDFGLVKETIRCRTQDQGQIEIRLTFKSKSREN